MIALCRWAGAVEDIYLKKNLMISYSKSMVGNVEDLITFSPNYILQSTNYQNILIVSESDIYNFLKKIFNREFKKRIEELYGFKYSVDYFVAYENMHVSNDVVKSVYADKWHVDKLFSKNCLKIAILMEDVNENKGPMEYINLENSVEISKSGNLKNIESYEINKFIGNKGDFLVFEPNRIYHKAGIPDKGKSRKQIILQLNPSTNWRINKSLYKEQFFKEPNLPFIKKFFRTYDLIP